MAIKKKPSSSSLEKRFMVLNSNDNLLYTYENAKKAAEECAVDYLDDQYFIAEVKEVAVADGVSFRKLTSADIARN